DQAQAPAMSNGFLLSDLAAASTSFTISPSGIGNAEYPASGKLNIGGSEGVSFTRSGDSFTITRGQLHTVAADHKAQDRCQIILEFFGIDVAEIIKTLMVDYGGVPEDYIPIADWLAETEGFLGTVYTSYITEPTPVETLINELIEQAALCVWWD